MGMLEYNELVPRKVVVIDGTPYEVLTSHVFRKQQRKPVNQTKLKSLINGKTIDRTFHHTDKIDEAELEVKKVKYLYVNRGEYWFCEEKDPSKRFSLAEDIVGKQIQYMKPNSILDAQLFSENIIGFKYPIKVELVVTEAPPAVKGDTVTGGSKTVVLETGATVNVPMFITAGEVIRLNTDTGEYTERVGNSY